MAKKLFVLINCRQLFHNQVKTILCLTCIGERGDDLHYSNFISEDDNNREADKSEILEWILI